MKRLLSLSAAILLLALSVRAQSTKTSRDADPLPRFEVSGGYSYRHTPNRFRAANENGWGASLAVNLNRWIAVKTDFAGYYHSYRLPLAQGVSLVPPAPGTPPPPIPVIIPPSNSLSTHTFLAGPQFSYRMSHGKLFAHGLVGAELVHVHMPGFNLPGTFPTVVPAVSFTNHTLYWAAGGGGDWMVTKSLGWRVAQVDYVETGHRLVQNRLRISTGLLWTFGR